MKKILLIADTSSWIFARHCKEIKNRIPDFDFDIAYYRGGDPGKNGYDKYYVIYALDPGMPISQPPPEKTIIGLRNEFFYSKCGPESLFNSKVKNRCKAFHVVNKTQFSHFENLCKANNLKFFLAPHGVDIDVFKPLGQEKSNDVFTVGFSGNKDSKGFKGVDIMQNVCNKNNIKFLQSGKYLKKEQMPSFYNLLDVYLCMSASEGLNNSIMEAGAMSIPVISTRSGAAAEIIKDGENGFLVERTEEALEKKLLILRDDVGLRRTLGNHLMETIKSDWSWNKKIAVYKEMFEYI